MDIRNFYQQHIDDLSSNIKNRRNRSKAFILGEIISFAAVFACVFLYTTSINGWMVTGLIAIAFAIYLYIRQADNRNNNTITKLSQLLSAHEHEMSYLDGNYDCFNNGQRFIQPQHRFAFDLDVFGKNSLFNRYCRTATTGGAKYLADALALNKYSEERLSVTDINLRSEAIKELSVMTDWRMTFISLGQEGEVDTEKIQHAINDIRFVMVPRFARDRFAAFLALSSLIGFLCSVIFSILQMIDAIIPVWWGIIQFFVVYILCNRTIGEISKAVNSLHTQLRTYIALIRMIATCKAKAQLNIQAAEELAEALPSFGQMENLLEALDRRGNILGMFFTNVFALSDFFTIRKFRRWQDSYIEKTDSWLNTVSRVDALVSMATMRFNHPEANDTNIIDDDKVFFEATQIAHPFLGSKAVTNDFSITNRNFYIITGANMAGKSTFLRTLGVNYILAMNGMPAFAQNLTMSIFALFTSMRTSDDLTHGISYFNAELLRLQQLLENIHEDEPCLIILDEILKGTNSVDKLNGSKMFLESVKNLNVTGIIATHDLELSKMATSYPEQFHNFCFEIELGTEVTYSYKIAPGVALNQNATFLLKQLLKSSGKF